MMKAAAVRKYQKFWIKRAALRKAKDTKEELPWHEDYSTLRQLCEALLNDEDRKVLDEIIMDDLIERTVDDNAEQTYIRLVAALQDADSGFRANCHLGDGSTPLHIVAKAGFSDCVRALIQRGADVNAVHLQTGHSVLQVAAMAGSYASMNHLINAGARRAYVNAMPGRNRTALHYAAERGSAPCLLLLLHPNEKNAVVRNEEVKQVKAVLNLQDAFGNTALHLACVDGSEDCVKMLLESGADPSVRNGEGKTAVDVARTMAAGVPSPATSAVLFMVAAAAGLDPLAETAAVTQEAAAAGAGITGDGGATALVAQPAAPDLLEGANSSNSGSSKGGRSASGNGSLSTGSPGKRAQQEEEQLRYSTGEPVLWVLVKDGVLVTSPAVPILALAGASPAPISRTRQPQASGAISKRLRFVRRSILGESSEESTTGDTGTEGGQVSARVEMRVEVFRSRREAEERARTVHMTRGSGCAASVRGTSSAAGSPDGVGQHPAGNGALAHTPSGPTPGAQLWGSAQRRQSGSGANAIDSGGINIGSGSALDAAGGAPVSLSQLSPLPRSAGSGPSTPAGPSKGAEGQAEFFTGFIDAASLHRFRASVPFYYPNGSPATTGGQRIGSQVGKVGGGTGAVGGEEEDPLWEQFKRRRSSSSQQLQPSPEEGQEEGDAKYRDISHSNRPVRLLQRRPSTVVPPSPFIDAVSRNTGEPAPSEPLNKNGDLPAGNSNNANNRNGSSGAAKLSRAELAARRLELTTEVAALQAEVFERMCRLLELQERAEAHKQAQNQEQEQHSSSNGDIAEEAAVCGEVQGGGGEYGASPSVVQDPQPSLLLELSEEDDEGSSSCADAPCLPDPRIDSADTGAAAGLPRPLSIDNTSNNSEIEVVSAASATALTPMAEGFVSPVLRAPDFLHRYPAPAPAPAAAEGDTDTSATERNGAQYGDGDGRAGSHLHTGAVAMELGSAMDLQSALMMEGIELSVHAEQLQWQDQEDLQEENRQAGDGALGDAGDEDGELNWHE